MNVATLIERLLYFPEDFEVVIRVDEQEQVLDLSDLAIDLIHIKYRTIIPENECLTRGYNDVIVINATSR